MTFDLDKLTPSPWTSAGEGDVAFDDGRDVPIGQEDHAAFIAAARNAFAAQMEYGWSAVRVESGMRARCWGVYGMTESDAVLWSGYILNAFPDPVTALNAAYLWKQLKAVAP